MLTETKQSKREGNIVFGTVASKVAQATQLWESEWQIPKWGFVTALIVELIDEIVKPANRNLHLYFCVHSFPSSIYNET